MRLAHLLSRCHKRESFIQLELGTYRTESATIELKAALQTMVGPRAVVESPESMVVDPTLLRLLVQEVVSNALKYSEDGSPINVKAEILPGVRLFEGREGQSGLTRGHSINNKTPTHNQCQRTHLSTCVTQGTTATPRLRPLIVFRLLHRRRGFRDASPRHHELQS